MAKLRSKLSIHRHCLDQPSLPHALRYRCDPSLVVVQFRASFFHVAAPAVYCLDGREQIGTATSCLLCGGFLPRKRDLHSFDLGEATRSGWLTCSAAP